MSPAQAIRMQTERGRKLFINNVGPETSANLRAKGGPGATPVTSAWSRSRRATA